MESSGSRQGSVASIGRIEANIPSDVSSSIAQAVVENMKSIMHGAMDQLLERERALLQELLAPIQDQICAPKAHRTNPNQMAGDDEVSIDSESQKPPTLNATPSVGHWGSAIFRSCQKDVRAATHRDHRHHTRMSLSSMSSRRSSGQLEPHDVEALQTSLDGEILALAALVPSSRSHAASSKSISPRSSSAFVPSPDDSIVVVAAAAPPGRIVGSPSSTPSDQGVPAGYGLRGNSGRELSLLPAPSEQGPCNPGQPGRLGAHQPNQVPPAAQLYAKSFSQRSMTVENLRSEREAELTQNYQQQNSMLSSIDDSIDSRVHVYRSFGTDVLRVCGLLPWFLDCDEEDYNPTRCQYICNTLWQKLILCLATVACGSCVWLTLDSWQRGSGNCRICLQVSLLFDAFLSMANVFCLLHISIIQRMVLFRAHHLLLNYAHQHFFLSAWRAASCRALACTCAFTLCVSWGRARVVFAGAAGSLRASVGFAASLFAVAIFMSLEFYILHVCHALATMIDCFSVDYVQQQNIGMAIREWNIIQATLRKVCAAVQWVFLVLQVAAVLTVTTGLMAAFQGNVFDAPALLPGTLVAISVTHVFFRAAVVTNKCERLTRFINSISFTSKEIDRERQYVVDYINNSGAGFYFFNVRLTSQMAIKIMYVSGLAAFYTATKAVSIL